MNCPHLQKLNQLLSTRILQLLLCASIYSSPIAANAQGSDSIEFLYSEGFDVPGQSEQSLLTYKHSRTWSIGDNFYFLDMSNLGNFENAGNTYFEWGPRLSPGKIFGDGPLVFGLIKDIYLVGELNYVNNKFVEKASFLAGPSVDLDIPGFRFFKLHLMNRNDPTLAGHTQQITMAWNFPFTLGRHSFSFEGFYDIVGKEGRASSQYHGQPQLIWYLHDKVSVGIEYMYWKNKTGRSGFNESALQGMIKYTF